MSEIDEFIEKKYIPHLIENLLNEIDGGIEGWTKEEIIEFFVAFESQVKMKRERLSLLKTKNNQN